MTSANESSKKLISQTTDLRDELMVAATKLERYVNALQDEVLRLKALAAADRRQKDEG